jgi:hypothetical protein
MVVPFVDGVSPVPGLCHLRRSAPGEIDIASEDLLEERVRSGLVLADGHGAPPPAGEADREPLTDRGRLPPALGIKVSAAQRAAGRERRHTFTALRAIARMHAVEDGGGRCRTAKGIVSRCEEIEARERRPA